MFRELAGLIKTRPLTITVVALGGDSLRVCVIPQTVESDKNVNDKAGYNKDVAKIPEVAIQALTTPLCLEGTAEELDAEMPEKLSQFSESHKVLRGALSEAQAQIAEAVKAIQDRDKAKNKTKPVQAKGSNASSTAKDDDESNGKDTKQRDRSESLPLEWCAPPTSSSPNNTPINNDPKIRPQTESAK